LIPNAGYGLYSIGMDRGMKMGSSAAAGAGAQQAGAVDPATGKRIPYWHDPMVPGQKFDKPGKSPFMDMQLVPVYADEAGTEGTVRIDPACSRTLACASPRCGKGRLRRRSRRWEPSQYNERDAALVQARANGYVESLHVRATLDPVRKGEPLAELYVPDWVAAPAAMAALQSPNPVRSQQRCSGIAMLAGRTTRAKRNANRAGRLMVRQPGAD